MTEQLNNVFANETLLEVSSTRGLAGTAHLVSTASIVVGNIMASITDADAEAVKLAASSHEQMDAFITARYDISTLDVEFVKLISDEDVEKMLKSQQSKKSRAKSRTMTRENFISYMNAAVSEMLLRAATGKDKSHGGGHKRSTIVSYSEERIEEYKNDKELLAREIRNIQSKKSIMKSKPGFNTESAEWQALLAAEVLLKGLRGTSTNTVFVDNTKDQLAVLLAETDVTALKAADSKELLAKIQELLNM